MNLGGGMIVPMLAHGRVLGACVFANHRQRAMSDEDRQLMRALGERAAVLLDNARLLRFRRDVTTDLQAALLPPSLPIIPGFELGARYEPAHQGLDVGGDFYDVVAISPERWLLVIGDVTGHGAKAAAATGLVRHTIRSGAMLGMEPSEILDHANQAMLAGKDSLAPGIYCAVALAMLDTSEVPVSSGTSVVRVVVASGGHQPLMLRRADGRVESVQTHGRLIGYFPSVEANQLTVDLYAGDTLVAFTDGVTERHLDSEWFGESELTKLLATSDPASDADAVAGIIRDAATHAFPNAPKDDMTILILRRPPVQ
jgi:serine phosphatase RsbU (regulator of sigma subunit)